MWAPPVMLVGLQTPVRSSKYSYLRTINPSDIGVMWPLT